MPGYSDPGFDTLALHAGAAPDPTTGARAVPIHLTTSFVFESSDHAAALFNLERAGHVYSRISVAIDRCSAAWPLAVAMAPMPPSSADTRCSSTALVGLLMRE